jgi:hypothetical protein
VCHPPPKRQISSAERSKTNTRFATREDPQRFLQQISRYFFAFIFFPSCYFSVHSHPCVFCYQKTSTELTVIEKKNLFMLQCFERVQLRCLALLELNRQWWTCTDSSQSLLSAVSNRNDKRMDDVEVTKIWLFILFFFIGKILFAVWNGRHEIKVTSYPPDFATLEYLLVVGTTPGEVDVLPMRVMLLCDFSNLKLLN